MFVRTGGGGGARVEGGEHGNGEILTNKCFGRLVNKFAKQKIIIIIRPDI